MSGHFTTGFMSVGAVSAGKLVLTNTTSNQDAVDRLRTSSTKTLFSSSAATKLDLIKECIYVDGTGCSVANDGNGANILTVSTTINTYAITQSYRYIPFPMGKSRITTLACTFLPSHGSITSYTTSRVGLFDSAIQKPTGSKGNGHFFQLTSGGLSSSPDVMSVVVRSNVSDDGNDIKFDQPQWNIDKMDGTGPSGEIILASGWRATTHIFVIDEQYRGRVRYGLYINGVIYYVHTLTTTVTQPKLPVRFELMSTGTTGGTMGVFYSVVESECGYDEDISLISSSSFSLPWPYTATGTINSTDGALPLLTLRTSDRTTLQLKNISIVTNGLLYWGVCIHPNASFVDYTTSAGSFISVSSYSSASFLSAVPGTITFKADIFNAPHLTIPDGANGIIVNSGMCSSGLTICVCDVDCLIDSNVVGNSMLLTLFARSFSDNVGVRATLAWCEK